MAEREVMRRESFQDKKRNGRGRPLDYVVTGLRPVFAAQLLGDDLFHDLTMDVGQTEIATGVSIS